MPELTITSPYVDLGVDSNTFTMGIGQPYAGVDINSMPQSTLFRSQGHRIWPLDHQHLFYLRTICSDCPPDVRSDDLYIYVLYVQAKGSHIEEVSDEILGKLACVYFTINRALKLK